MLRQRPALRFVLLLCGGIILAGLLPAAPAVGLPLLIFLFALACIPLLVPRLERWFSASLHAVVVALGFALTQAREADVVERRISGGSESDSIEVVSVLEETPFLQGNSFRLVVAADSLQMHGVWDPHPRRLLVLLRKRDFPYGIPAEVGDLLRLRGSLDEFPRARNPGEFDYGRFLALTDIDGVVRGTEVRRDSAERAVSFRRWFNIVRSYLGEILERHHGPEQASFLRGVLFGDRRDLPVELKESFLVTGTIHILAVSGSNVAVVALILFLTFGLFRLPRIPVILLTIAGLFFYMMLTGASSSIVRATIMGSVLLGGRMTERRTDIYNSISVAACVVLLWDPLQLFDVGFQLSFAAVLSIVYFYPRLDALLRKIPSEWEELRALHALWQVFAVSFAAQIGTLPFTAYYFERFSVISLAANLIVVPLVGLNLMVGCLTLAAAFLSETVASVYAAVNEVLSNVLLGSVRVAASVPYASVETSAFSPDVALLFYIVLLALFNIRQAFVVKAAVVGVLLVLTGQTFAAVFRNLEKPLEIISLDVGQGDGHVIRFPNGGVFVVDAGPAGLGFDAGERVVKPFLRRSGISTIDAVLITHPHADHAGGVAALLEHFEVRKVVEAGPRERSALKNRLDSLLGRRKTVWQSVQAGEELSPDPAARLYLLHPVWNRDSLHSANDRSLVFKLQYGNTSALFTGDAEETAEELVLTRFGPFLDSDLLKVGHHGSRTSSTERFLHSITPNFAIISVGRRNKFGHPSGEVVERMTERGIGVLRTDREGAVIMQSDGNVWNRIHWRTRSP